MKLKKSVKGTYFIEDTSYVDLINITDNMRPICDECCVSLIDKKDIMVLPILNAAYCSSCGNKKIHGIRLSSYDLEIQDRRVKYYKEVLGIKG